MVIDYYQGNICGLQLASCTTQLFEIRNDFGRRCAEETRYLVIHYSMWNNRVNDIVYSFS